MSNGLQKVSQRKQVRSALERIEGLEQEMPRIVMAVNEALTGQGQQVQQLASIVEAVVELFGSDTVDAKIKELADAKVTKNLANAKAALEKGLASGEVVLADAINDNSLVVGREFKADGEVVFPGRVQLQFRAIKPEFQEKLRGQGVGFTVETAGGGKFEVLEVYTVVEAAPAPTETPAGLDEALTPSES
jgi:hypothetical protein